MKNVLRRSLCLGLIISALPLCAAPPGTVVAWGRNNRGQTNVPAGLHDVIAIAAGGAHTVALRSNGTVVAWGWNNYGQTNVPAGLNDVIAIAAGWSHTVALRSDGSVVAWGENSSRQTNVPAGLRDVKSIAAGGLNTLALKSDGTVVAWGSYGDVSSAPGLSPPPGLRDAIAIAAGGDFVMALTSNGTVVAWGDTEWGEAVDAPRDGSLTSIAAGSYHAVALKSDGRVLTWGAVWTGSRDGSAFGVPRHRVDDVGLSGVVAIAAGDVHSVALKSDGTVEAWGANWAGQTDVPAGLNDVIAISAGAGGDHTVALVPSIVVAQQPASQRTSAGQGATFTAKATGAGPLSYQWLKDGINVPGATRDSLTLTSVQADHIGNYAVVISNAYETVTSNLAVLTMNQDSVPPGKLVNFSVRAAIDSRAPTLIAGFAVGGEGTLPVLMRGVGPTLTAFGVSGPLSDPVLTLFHADTVLGSNDNWDSTSPVGSVGAGLGAFALAPGSLDAALFHSGIAAGSYTVQIAGKSALAGVALAEIYDATPMFATAAARLVNVSARGQVDGGGNDIVAGFVVAGRGSTQLLIRGFGPTLVRFGVTGALEDPVLRIYDRAGTLIATNDDWNSDPLLRAAFLAAHAFEPAAGSKDAALLLRLQPGSYTAVLSRASGTGGEGLIEIYEIP